MDRHTAGPSNRSLRDVISLPQARVVGWSDFRCVVEASEDLLTVLDQDGRIIYDNPAVEAVLGYRQGELVGRNAFELIHADDYPRAVALLAELATGARISATLAFRFRRQGGGWCRLESSGRVVSGSPGALRIVVASRECSAEPAPESTLDGPPAGELEEARVEVVERLARAAEFRDDETGQHLRRVGELAATLAAELALPPREVEIVRRAAPLHDVGKIGIPDAILLKPGPLLPEEEEVMRTHPVLGARILAGGGTTVVRAAEEIARCHHERWDGLGYPEGLTRERIPRFARMVSIVDFFDALTHDRPYRRAWEPERVLAMIRAESGTRFEPELAAAFVALMERSPEVA